jgi:hypothetical protein
MMGENNTKSLFCVGAELQDMIAKQTTRNGKPFQQRDFVLRLVSFCEDGDFTANIGIAFGLRSTGKTVGMLQAAQYLMDNGEKVAYASFNYLESGFNQVNAEIIRLAQEGVTHFFVDEAPYLSGFLVNSAEWADSFVPKYGIKIIVSGTDSFELWLAMTNTLYHRYVSFSTNRNSFPEFVRLIETDYSEYRRSGGIFLSREFDAAAELEPGRQSIGTPAIETFIDTAIVDNLVHTLEHAKEYYEYGRNYYNEWLSGIDKRVICKGVIAILKSTVEAFIRRNFIQDADKKNIPNLGQIIERMTYLEKCDIKRHIADSIGIYQNTIPIEDPKGAIEALTEFLTKIGCLVKSGTGQSDLTELRSTLYFSHPALMNYAINETKKSLVSSVGLDVKAFSESIDQAAEGSFNENIVYFHLMLSLRGYEKIFSYHDSEEREIDAVIIDRKAKTIKLIEVKSKLSLSKENFQRNEAKHLCDNAILFRIGVDTNYTVTRVVVYRGKTHFRVNKEHAVVAVNLEDLLMQGKDALMFLDNLGKQAKDIQKDKYPMTFVEQMCEDAGCTKTLPPKQF